MSKLLWVAQVLLAVAFLLSGMAKVAQPKEALAANMDWVEDFSQGSIQVIGALEVLGAIGLIVPALTGILPWLTPLAAGGLALTMIGAMITHAARGEYGMILLNLILLLLAVFVAFGRWRVAPTKARHAT